jgi:phage terminase small subunit
LLEFVEFSSRIAELAEAAAQGAVMAAREVLVELSRIGRANMLDYMRIGPSGDPVLDFSRLSRDQSAGLIEVSVEDFLDGLGENAREHPGSMTPARYRASCRTQTRLVFYFRT